MFFPIFALGGGVHYLFEYGFGYILAFIPAIFFSGTLLKVKPILIFNKEGKLQKYKQSTGLKHTIATAVKEVEKYTINKDYPLFTVAHTDNLEMANLLAESLKTSYKAQTEIRMIGPVIGSHLGPNAVAYIFLSNEERPL